MKKIIRIGTMPELSPRGKTVDADIFCKITLEACKLSISGVVGPRSNGDAYGSCGQIDSTIREALNAPLAKDRLTFSPEWNRVMLAQFLDVWGRYHLNYMRAECEHQRAAGLTYAKNAGHVCPTCNYEIGTAWKFEEVPADAVAFLESLPETTITPAWI